MIAVDNFFQNDMASSRLLLNSPLFLCVCGKLYIFFLSSSPAEKATLHFSLTMYKSKGRQKKLPPPTYTHRKKKKKPQPPHMLFCLDFSHGSGLQILWTIKHHITNKSKAYTHTPLFSLSSSKEKKNMGKKGK